MILTSVLEDYLKVILELNENSGSARVTDIADRLKVTKATVSQTINKLIGLGMAKKAKYGTVSLTAEGRVQAKEVQNRNIAIRDFLTEVLGVDNKVSEKDACMMEHIVSFETVEKIKSFLNNDGFNLI